MISSITSGYATFEQVTDRAVAVGDTVTAYSPAVGVSTRGTITKLTVKVADGRLITS